MKINDNLLPEKVQEIKPIDRKSERIPLNKKMYRYAKDQNMTLTQLLEYFDPSKPNEKTTAFERELKRRDLRVNSIPEKGIYASPIVKFFETDTNAVLFPEVLNNIARWEPLVSRETPYKPEYVAKSNIGLPQNEYKSLYISDSLSDYRQSRVTERGGFPRFSIDWSAKSSQMKKYGIEVNWSYEFARRTSIDILRPVISRIYTTQIVDEFYDLIDLAINGDGTDISPAPSSTTANSYDSDISSDGTITYKAWLWFLFSFLPYQCTHVFCRKDVAYEILTMTGNNVNTRVLDKPYTANFAGNLAGVVGFSQSPTLVVLGDDYIAANTILGVDNSNAMQRFYEIGADLEETEKVIDQQINRIIISHVSGAAKIFSNATKVMTLTV